MENHLLSSTLLPNVGQIAWKICPGNLSRPYSPQNWCTGDCIMHGTRLTVVGVCLWANMCDIWWGVSVLWSIREAGSTVEGPTQWHRPLSAHITCPYITVGLCHESYSAMVIMSSWLPTEMTQRLGFFAHHNVLGMIFVTCHINT